MNTETGEIIDEAKLRILPLAERRKFIPVVRDLTKHEQSRKQIALYSPCACGSGKKFKFCCYTGNAK